MIDRIFLPRWLWLGAVGVWLLSGVVNPNHLLMALFFVAAGLGQPLVSKTLPDGTRETIWEITDWIGLSILLVVVWALANGISPVDIIKALRG